jgi:glycosyltransferase involved in cell wall biosynthesis
MTRKLSIITVNRNNAGGLKKTIASVICQTFTDFEFIIIDGASDDDSVGIIKEYSDHISYWVSEPDKGTYQAMNKGIHVATGEYCLFLNSGDYLINREVLEKVFKHIITEDIISGNILKTRANMRFRRVTSPPKVSLHKLCIHSLPHQGTFIKTNLFEEIGYYEEDYKINSDWEFFINALVIHRKSYYHLDIDVSYFSLGGISSIGANDKLARQESLEILKKYFPYMAEDLMEYRSFYSSNIGQILKLLLARKRLYKFVDDFFGIILKSKKKLIGK